MEKTLVRRVAHCKRYWLKEEQLTWQAHDDLELFLDAIIKQRDTVLRHLGVKKECSHRTVKMFQYIRVTDDGPEEVAEVIWKLYLFKSLRHLETTAPALAGAYDPPRGGWPAIRITLRWWQESLSGDLQTSVVNLVLHDEPVPKKWPTLSALSVPVGTDLCTCVSR